MILVTGGAGYIGSHVVKSLLNKNHEVIVLDNLSTGYQAAVDQRAIFIEGDIRAADVLNHIFATYPITGVMHFSANCYVGESVLNPLKYYHNNVSGSISLLKQMLDHHVKKLVFSSTCAVYGTPNVDKIDETTATNPINPYGQSKLMIEQVIKDLSGAHGFEYMILRYFNVAGADPSGTIGEHHDPETHLIPNILQHLSGLTDKVIVFGSDYPTNDGTCIRDYIHVDDLAEAHILALKNLVEDSVTKRTYNLGNENGYSVNEVIQMCENISGKKANVVYLNRREGDPAKLVSSSEKIYRELGWKARYSLKEMIETAWNWHLSYPNGYGDI